MLLSRSLRRIMSEANLRMKSTDLFYSKVDEPNKSCLLALRDLILSFDSGITHELKYGMPFFIYKGKMICYLWTHKKFLKPYIGVVDGNKMEHPGLLLEKRARMKILLVDAEKDLDVKSIKLLLKKILALRG